MGSWTSTAQRNLANRKEDIENGEIDRNSDYLYAARDTMEALTYLQMGSGHHPTVKDDLDQLTGEATDVLSQMSTWETMEEQEQIPDNLKADLKEIIDDTLELSMEYRDSGFALESIRH